MIYSSFSLFFFHPSLSSSTLHFTAHGGFSMLHLMTLINSHSLSLMSQISHKPNEKEKKGTKLASSSFLMSPDRTKCFKSTKLSICFAERKTPAEIIKQKMYKCEFFVHLSSAQCCLGKCVYSLVRHEHVLI